MLKLIQTHDRREFGRRKADVIAWINVRGEPARRCTVLNVSEGGALIEFTGTDRLPDRFNLTLDSGLKLECDVRHRRGSTVGVEFVITEAPRGIVADTDNASSKRAATPQFRNLDR